MAVGVVGEPAERARWRWCRPPPAPPAIGAGVGLVDDDELGAGPQEVVAVPVGLDEVESRRRCAGSARRATRPARQAALEPRGGAGQHELGVDVELVAHLRLPLLGEVRRAEDGEALDLAAVEQLAGDEAGLDVLPMPTSSAIEQADRVEPQRHEQRHELVRAAARRRSGRS